MTGSNVEGWNLRILVGALTALLLPVSGFSVYVGAFDAPWEHSLVNPKINGVSTLKTRLEALQSLDYKITDFSDLFQAGYGSAGIVGRSRKGYNP